MINIDGSGGWSMLPSSNWRFFFSRLFWSCSTVWSTFVDIDGNSLFESVRRFRYLFNVIIVRVWYTVMWAMCTVQIAFWHWMVTWIMNNSIDSFAAPMHNSCDSSGSGDIRESDRLRFNVECYWICEFQLGIFLVQSWLRHYRSTYEPLKFRNVCIQM